jgi:hypothetical protein
MGRRQQEEMNFGSDSFLDVIANIVGILIILIVIAGVRVSQQAVEVADAVPLPAVGGVSESNFVPPAPLPPLLPSLPEPAPVLTEAQQIDPAITAAILAASEPKQLLPPVHPKPKPRPVMPAYVPETPKPIAPLPELQSAIARFKTELGELQQKSKQADQSQQQLSRWNNELSEQIDSARKTLQSSWDEGARQKQQLQELKRSLERTKLEFIGKQQQLTEAEKQQSPAALLQHRLTPISREIDGNEIHFQVKDNRVAYVPLLELVERMKPQIQRQREWLLKYHEHRGRVGPYRGFQLDYLVVRQRMSALDEARAGGVARVMPVLLKFEPQKELVREALDEALRPGSVFIRELQMADVNTTLTFWVYPESYGTYRQLKEFAHAEGFTVAARPLQEGDAITASPWGSKSAGQ